MVPEDGHLVLMSAHRISGSLSSKLREQALVEIVERSLPAAGHSGRTLEDGLHIMM